MKVTDKEILTLLEKSGNKSNNELFHILKKKYPNIEKHKIIRRLNKLKSKQNIRGAKTGNYVPQIKSKKAEPQDDLPINDFYEICKKYNYRYSFTRKQYAEAEVSATINPDNLKERKDFRKDLIITIDGSDAKDLDDAISIDKTRKKYTLKVHIADVSNYVKEDSTLDREARKRGNSVYLVDKVIPMLPEALSNGICSLNQKEDRLSLSAVIEFDREGEITNYSFHEGIIHVGRRFTYDEVEDVLQKGKAITKDQKPFVKSIKIMNELAEILYQKRVREGSIDFNFDEVKIICDQNSQPVEVIKKKRLFSMQIIEEFMLR
ncbi:MAG: RNB domain-containing ribonuclease, partial [Spirochaetota bacterium]|nr:RNB domain-containing ribonuclease [Spirochaetota bacterium]